MVKYTGENQNIIRSTSFLESRIKISHTLSLKPFLVPMSIFEGSMPVKMT